MKRPAMYLPVALTLLTALTVANAADAQAAGWRTDGTGAYPNTKAPSEWSTDQNVVWRCALPSWSNATPVVLDDRVICCSEPATVIAVDKANGKILWQTPVTYKDAGVDDPPKRPRTHSDNGYTSYTPVVHGDRVFVLFGTGLLAALDVKDGEILWARLMKMPGHGWGHSASPTWADGKLIVQTDQVYALNPENGQTVWSTPAKWRWGTPVPTTVGQTPIIITAHGDVIRAADGHVLARGIGTLAYASPVIDGNRVYFIERKAVAVELPDSADEPFKVTPLWSSRIKGSRHYASPVIHDGLIYAASREEIVNVLDAATGEVVYQERHRLGGRNVNSVYPSVTLVGDRILVSSQSGQTTVFKPGRTPELLHMNKLEGFRASPVVDGDRLYIRTFKALYCLGDAAGR